MSEWNQRVRVELNLGALRAISHVYSAIRASAPKGWSRKAIPTIDELVFCLNRPDEGRQQIEVAWPWLPILRAFTEIGGTWRRQPDAELIKAVAVHLRKCIPRDRATAESTRDELLSAIHEAMFFGMLWQAGFKGNRTASKPGHPDIDLSDIHGITVEFTDCRPMQVVQHDLEALAERCHSEATAKLQQVAKFKPNQDLLRMIVIDLPAGCRAHLEDDFPSFIAKLNEFFTDFPQSYRVWLTLFDFGENQSLEINRNYKLVQTSLVLPPFPIQMDDLRYVAFQSTFWTALGALHKGLVSVSALELLSSGALTPAQLSELLKRSTRMTS